LGNGHLGIAGQARNDRLNIINLILLNMKKMIFLMLALLMLSAASMNAQVNIGSVNDPHKGAILDLSQSELNLGLLFPKVYLFNTREFTLPVDESVDAIGMVIYNNNASLPDGRGLYSWNGTEWKSMSGSTANSCIPVTATTTSTKEGNNAKITVNVTAGNPTYTYVWSKGENVVRTTANTTATSDTYTTTGADTYTVTVMNPCMATPVSFTFTVAGDGGTLKENGNGTQTDEEGNLVYNDETYAPVESDIPGIYKDESDEIVYTGADGIPGTEDDDVFVAPDYPLPTQETLFSIKYPVVVQRNRTYQIELDFANGSTYPGTYTGKIKFVSSNSNAISVNETGEITAGPNYDVSAIIAIILEDGSVIYPTFVVRPQATSISKLAEVLNSEVTLSESSTRKIGTSLRAVEGTGNAFNTVTLTYAMADDGNTGSTVTPGGWFHAKAPGVVTVTATATDDESHSFEGTITVTILGELTSEDKPYLTASENWTTLDPAPAYAGGNGTEASPYQISSVRQLKKLSVDIALLGSVDATYQKYFELTTDLDFSADETIKSTLIGTFCGTLDGKGHVIKDLNIDATGKSEVSLFGGLSYGEIKNLGREGGSITGNDTYGASGLISIIGNKGKLSNCYNSSSINIHRNAGGLVRAVQGGDMIIENCYNTGDVTVALEAASGLVGTVLYDGGSVTITNSYNAGTIATAQHSLGGLIYSINASVGHKQILNMNNCFNFSDVTITNNNDLVGSILGCIIETNSALVEINATNVYSRLGAASANGGSVPKPNQPIGWISPAGQNLATAILAANPTLKEDAKYTPEYSRSSAFVIELGNAFKFANGRTPKLAWEQ
jgi:hypothetical protein